MTDEKNYLYIETTSDEMLILIKGVDGQTNYAVFKEFGDVYIDTIFQDRERSSIDLSLVQGFDTADINAGINYVLDERRRLAEGRDCPHLVMKAFKLCLDVPMMQYGQDVDAGRTWVIDEYSPNRFSVNTEINGRQNLSLIKANDLFPIERIDTAVDLVKFLNRVYTENNPVTGKQLCSREAIYKNADAILNNVYDARKLLLSDKGRKDISYEKF